MEGKADLEIIKEFRRIGSTCAWTKDRYAEHVSHASLFKQCRHYLTLWRPVFWLDTFNWAENQCDLKERMTFDDFIKSEVVLNQGMYVWGDVSLR